MSKFGHTQGNFALTQFFQRQHLSLQPVHCRSQTSPPHCPHALGSPSCRDRGWADHTGAASLAPGPPLTGASRSACLMSLCDLGRAFHCPKLQQAGAGVAGRQGQPGQEGRSVCSCEFAQQCPGGPRSQHFDPRALDGHFTSGSGHHPGHRPLLGTAQFCLPCPSTAQALCHLWRTLGAPRTPQADPGARRQRPPPPKQLPGPHPTWSSC